MPIAFDHIGLRRDPFASHSCLLYILFLVFLAKFPHYKAAFRLAEYEYKKKNYRICASILFERLFLTFSTLQSKQMSTIFDNIAELKRVTHSLVNIIAKRI